MGTPDTEDVRQVGADHATVGDDGDGLAEVLGGEVVDDRCDTKTKALVGLGTRNAVPRTRAAPRHPLRIAYRGAPAELALAPVAEADLLEVLEDRDLQATLFGQGPRRLVGSAEMRREHRIDPLRGETLRQRRRLDDALGVERWIDRLHRTRDDVGRSPMADEQHLARRVELVGEGRLRNDGRGVHEAAS